jgi:hypothetical protein
MSQTFLSYTIQGKSVVISHAQRLDKDEQQLIQKIARKFGIEIRLEKPELPVKRASSGTRVFC